MIEPKWIDQRALLLLHAESLAEHGGLEGLRDEGLPDAALARPRNFQASEETEDLSRLAAAYAYRIARNHPFLDGNKRASFLSIGLFLGLNGQCLKADKIDAIQVTLALADNSLSEAQLADWIAKNLLKRP